MKKFRDYLYNGLWYSVLVFKSEAEVNKFLEENKDFSLLRTVETDATYYIVAKNTDKGAPTLNLYYDGEDSGFCQTYYKSKNGRLFVVVEGIGLHTCNDDAWREPGFPVKDESQFNLIKHQEVA